MGRTPAFLFVVFLCLLATTQASAQLLSQQDETVTAADGTTFVMTSAVVRVQAIRHDPASGSIDLAVVRARRVGAVPTASAHVMLAGGPGDSGVNLVLGMVKQGGAMLADIINGDLVGIDQRGTGKSTPLLASTLRYDLPQDRAGSPVLWTPLMERAIAAARADVEARGIRLDAYNTRESADDVEEVRRALGYERMSLWGRSYGTHLALATLRRYPGRVERLVLIGPEGPDHTWKLPGQVDRVIARLAERSAQPDLPAVMRQVIDRLAVAPAEIPLTHPVTKQPVTMVIGAFDLQWVTAQALGDPRAVRTLPAAYRQMAAGDFTGIAPVVLAFRARAGIESVMKHAMDVSSGASPARRAQIERDAGQSLLANAINFPGMFLERAWGVTDLGDEFRSPVTSDVPVLVLAGDMDPRTPVENAQEILATLPKGQLVVVANATHQFDVFGSAQVRDVLRRFLGGEHVANERIVLPPLVPPPGTR